MDAGENDNALEELLVLLSAYCDGSIDPDDGDRLARLLKSSDAARRRYFEYLDLHYSLRQIVGGALGPIPPTFDATDATISTIGRPASDHLSESPTGPPTFPAGSIRPGFLGTTIDLAAGWLSSPKALGLTVVASLATYFVGLMISVVLTRVLTDIPDPLSHTTLSEARVTAAANCLWRTAAPNLGEPLTNSKPLELAAGIAELTVGNGVRVLVEAPTRLEVVSAARIRLDRGKVVVTVPPAGLGFTVVTPSAELVDLGTEFGVEVAKSGATEVQVFRGRVEVAATQPEGVRPSISADSSNRLVAGQAARIDPKTNSVVERAVYKPDQFVRQLSDEASGGDRQLSKYAAEVIALTRPVLYWDFDGPPRFVGTDVVRSLKLDSLAVAEVGVAGPRPADGLAEMSDTNLGLSVAAGEGITCNQLTSRQGIAADVYSTQMWFYSAVEFNAQPLSFLWGRGIGWNPDTDLRDSLLVVGTHLEHGGETGHLAFSRGGSAVRLACGSTLLKSHVWYHVVFVRDGEDVQVYLNGQREISVRLPWVGGDGEHLTFGHRVHPQHPLGLNGRFDEVAIWNHALTEHEAQLAYELAIKKAPLEAGR